MYQLNLTIDEMILIKLALDTYIQGMEIIGCYSEAEIAQQKQLLERLKAEEPNYQKGVRCD